MTTQLQLDIVSPEGSIFSGPVSYVGIPASEGRIGVLPHHSPYLSSLAPGVIEIQTDETGSDKNPERHFVSAGFVEISDNKCTILVEDILPFAQLNEKQIDQQIQNLKEDLEDAKTDHDRSKIETALNIEEVKKTELQFYQK